MKRYIEMKKILTMQINNGKISELKINEAEYPLSPWHAGVTNG